MSLTLRKGALGAGTSPGMQIAGVQIYKIAHH